MQLGGPTLRDANDEIFRHFLDDHCFNLSNVTQLSCTHLEEEVHQDLFTKLFSKFPKLQSLKLWDCTCDSIHGAEARKLLPNLNALILQTTDISSYDLDNESIKDLITAFADKLEYLSFTESKDIDYEFSAVNFKNLTCFNGIHMSNNCINDILKTAVNLKRVGIDRTKDVTLSQLENIIIKIFNSCKLLENFEFGCDFGTHCGIESVLDGIEKGLFQTKDRKRKKMRLRIFTGYANTKDAQSLILNIGRIIHWLVQSAIEDFMFIWFIEGLVNDEKFDKELLLKDVKSIGFKASVIRNKNDIIISNENCKLDGYYEAWPNSFDQQSLSLI